MRDACGRTASWGLFLATVVVLLGPTSTGPVCPSAGVIDSLSCRGIDSRDGANLEPGAWGLSSLRGFEGTAAAGCPLAMRLRGGRRGGADSEQQSRGLFAGAGAASTKKPAVPMNSRMVDAKGLVGVDKAISKEGSSSMSEITSSFSGSPRRSTRRMAGEGLLASAGASANGMTTPAGSQQGWSADAEMYMPRVLRDQGQWEAGPSDVSRSSSPSARHQPQGQAGGGVPGIFHTRPLPPGRDEEFFKPTAFSTWANDVVSISFVRGKHDVGIPGRQSPPLFTHQVFGPQEEIIGYIKPKVDIFYAANTLRPTFRFTHDGVVDAAQLDAAGVTPTDVEKLIHQKVPCDYAASIDEVLQHASDTAFTPVGFEVGSFEAASGGAGWRNTGSGADKLSKFKIFSSDLRDEESRALVRRLESLAVWLIERASYIAIDGNWELLTMYEVFDQEGKEAYQLVGFTTMYRDYRGGKSGGASGGLVSSEDATMSDDVVETYRLRISQFVILPHFQRCGHGGQLLRHIYRRARESSEITEVCVENPSPRFSTLRDRTDSRLLIELGHLESILGSDPPYEELHSELKLGRTQLRHLAVSVIRKVVYTRPQAANSAGSSKGELCSLGGVDYFAGDYVLVRSPNNLPYLAHLVGVNPVTGLLRVRWVYRYDDIPESALRTFSKKSSNLYKRRRVTSLEAFYSFHEDLAPAQALMGKANILYTSQEPVDPDVHIKSPGTFFCRFVFDPARERVWSLAERNFKSKYRRTLDDITAGAAYPHPVYSSTAKVGALAGDGARGASPMSSASIRDGEEGHEDSSIGLAQLRAAGSDTDTLDSVMAVAERGGANAADLSSVAYSDIHSHSEVVPYSPPGVGFVDSWHSPSRGRSRGSRVGGEDMCHRRIQRPGSRESIVGSPRRRSGGGSRRAPRASPRKGGDSKKSGGGSALQELKNAMLLAPRPLAALFNDQHVGCPGNDTRLMGGKSLGGAGFLARAPSGDARIEWETIVEQMSSAATVLASRAQHLSSGGGIHDSWVAGPEENELVLTAVSAHILRTCSGTHGLLTKLIKHADAWPFLEPVDPVAHQCKDYFTVIKQPMDLGTVGKQLESGTYASIWHLASHVLLTFDNAMKYNPPHHSIHKKALRLSSSFKEKLVRTLFSASRVLSDHAADPWPIACAQVMRGLLLRPGSWPFLEPVDPIALGIPDYHEVIKRPMDLGSVARRLQSGAYPHAGEFAFEVNLVVTNAMTYNPPGHQVHQLAKRLGEVFGQQWQVVCAALDARAQAAEEAQDAMQAAE